MNKKENIPMNYYGTEYTWSILSDERKEKYKGGIIYLFESYADLLTFHPYLSLSDLIQMIKIGE